MDTTILLFMAQDGAVNGAIYALLGLCFVLVFTVTRVIFIPQGEFVAFGALSFGLMESGRLPGTIWLLLALAAVAFLMDFYEFLRGRARKGALKRAVLLRLVVPGALAAFAGLASRAEAGAAVHLLATIALLTPIGPLLYRVAFQPLGDASLLVLLIAAVGVHIALVNLGLVLFGPEGLRAPTLWDASFNFGSLMVSGQSLIVIGAALAGIFALALFFGRTLWGKALRATAVNRLGARLVGVRPSDAGALAFTLAAAIGAVSGALIAPLTTVYYDSGLVIGLKGMVAAIVGALASYPLTALAALGVGLIESFAAFFASSFKEVIVFMMVLPALAWRSLAHVAVEEED